ncbi:Metallo-dependent phosphatase [Decorospora gaudefroyi]|uniref:Metallo-dependent phosphatase n=1 Tax=Decorospora gaudefroyi TaxID=184978 RepID=A0A6A5KFK3_9PLEO|nr:Metallo-dependent phosphatase [Decorospora gaudefroyi]
MPTLPNLTHPSPNDNRRKMSSKRRKTRIVCISDTHNQTPKLPRGDVLIHAGDLTNQGSYSELQKSVRWLEGQGFEAKIVVAGNHDITLDAPFFRQHGESWKWPGPQDPEACKRLLTASESITYLEHTSTTICLHGAGTEFSVFGSPCTPKQGNWAFQYTPEEAEGVWSKMAEGVDIVVTHTPPKGHCDGTLAQDTKDQREGCPALLERLEQVRPVLSVCGHIHGGRGVETARWKRPSRDPATCVDRGSLVESVAFWNDPGASNKKLSIVDLTIRSTSGHGLGCDTSLTRQRCPNSMRGRLGGQPDTRCTSPDERSRQPSSGDEKLISTTSLTESALYESEALRGGGGALEHGDIGYGSPDEATRLELMAGKDMPRKETTVINAAYLGPRIAGKPRGYNKPIVVDVELPIWDSSH